LFNNQVNRFTDAEQQRLFSAVQAHVAAYSSQHEPDYPALGLVQDALAMPFTVFTTAQKQKMLKWLDKLNGLEAGTPRAAAGDPGAVRWTLLDVTASTAEVMNHDGDTQLIELSVCDAELVAQLQGLFAETEAGDSSQEVVVELGVRHNKPAIVRLACQT
jgi:hypothetical protein